jgi:hypothetical protein
MEEWGTLIALLAGAVIALAMLSLAMLRGWEGWLALRRMELSQSSPPTRPSPALARLELADLKERVRRLETIANGNSG